MTKIWLEAFWKAPPPSNKEIAHGPGLWSPATYYLLLAPVVLLAALTVALGLAAEAMLVLSLRAAKQLMDPSEYIRAVLGRRT